MCRRKNIEYKVGDFVKARRDIEVNSGDFLKVFKGTNGTIKQIDGSNAVVVFTFNGVDRSVLVRFDYIKPAK